jgi:hypothetical protein
VTTSAKRVILMASTRAPWMEREACELTEETVASACATANVAVAIAHPVSIVSRIVKGSNRGASTFRLTSQRIRTPNRGTRARLR